MYKQKSFSTSYKKKRWSSPSNKGNFNKSSSWKSRPKRNFKQKIDPARYVSRVSEVLDHNLYNKEHTFAEFALHPTLSNNINAVGYTTPTQIQAQTIPAILAKQDVLGIANTGSGKTGAFLIPLINNALKDNNRRTLIVCPTRELANQINNEYKKFAAGTAIKMVVVIGGSNMSTQIKLLNDRPHFVVATPGRLIDLETRKRINLQHFSCVVLDEVDQMLDMGFVEDIKKIIAKLAANRQSVFFSATMSPKEEELVNTLLTQPVKVQISKQTALASIHQDIVKVTSHSHKLEKLHELLKQTAFTKVLVFSATKSEADKISLSLRKGGFRVDSLHGDKSQFTRTKVLGAFRQDKIDILVATDVAARGIDVPDITHVINYDEPSNYNDYIHRIGRTGRIGKTGTALTFVFDR